jgi:hypothetical protein
VTSTISAVLRPLEWRWGGWLPELSLVMVLIALALMVRGPDLIRNRRHLLYKYAQRLIINRPAASLSCVHRINTL